MKNNKGFTLVELLVVIAIIGILSSVAIVQLNVARTKARRAALQQVMATIKSAVAVCHDKHGAIQDGSGSSCPTGAGLINPTWAPITAGGLLCVDPPMYWPAPPTGTSFNVCSYNSLDVDGNNEFGWLGFANPTFVSCRDDQGCQ
ncbi:type II secretion system protein [Candidatus Parcubacteria bacterium]|jgi:prepilin-type N-terminal cleavage/methylation domain-containing protein|nr:type II secretion system protein [Candidatus Parcubacteria bacterium]